MNSRNSSNHGGYRAHLPVSSCSSSASCVYTPFFRKGCASKRCHDVTSKNGEVADDFLFLSSSSEKTKMKVPFNLPLRLPFLKGVAATAVSSASVFLLLLVLNVLMPCVCVENSEVRAPDDKTHSGELPLNVAAAAAARTTESSGSQDDSAISLGDESLSPLSPSFSRRRSLTHSSSSGGLQTHTQWALHPYTGTSSRLAAADHRLASERDQPQASTASDAGAPAAPKGEGNASTIAALSSEYEATCKRPCLAAQHRGDILQQSHSLQDTIVDSQTPPRHSAAALPFAALRTAAGRELTEAGPGGIPRTSKKAPAAAAADEGQQSTAEPTFVSFQEEVGLKDVEYRGRRSNSSRPFIHSYIAAFQKANPLRKRVAADAAFPATVEPKGGAAIETSGGEEGLGSNYATERVAEQPGYAVREKVERTAYSRAAAGGDVWQHEEQQQPRQRSHHWPVSTGAPVKIAGQGEDRGKIREAFSLASLKPLISNALQKALHFSALSSTSREVDVQTKKQQQQQRHKLRPHFREEPKRRKSGARGREKQQERQQKLTKALERKVKKKQEHLAERQIGDRADYRRETSHRSMHSSNLDERFSSLDALQRPPLTAAASAFSPSSLDSAAAGEQPRDDKIKQRNAAVPQTRFHAAPHATVELYIPTEAGGTPGSNPSSKSPEEHRSIAAIRYYWPQDHLEAPSSLSTSKKEAAAPPSPEAVNAANFLLPLAERDSSGVSAAAVAASSSLPDDPRLRIRYNPYAATVTSTPYAAPVIWSFSFPDPAVNPAADDVLTAAIYPAPFDPFIVSSPHTSKSQLNAAAGGPAARGDDETPRSSFLQSNLSPAQAARYEPAELETAAALLELSLRSVGSTPPLPAAESTVQAPTSTAARTLKSLYTTMQSSCPASASVTPTNAPSLSFSSSSSSEAAAAVAEVEDNPTEEQKQEVRQRPFVQSVKERLSELRSSPTVSLHSEYTQESMDKKFEEDRQKRRSGLWKDIHMKQTQDKEDLHWRPVEEWQLAFAPLQQQRQQQLQQQQQQQQEEEDEDDVIIEQRPSGRRSPVDLRSPLQQQKRRAKMLQTQHMQRREEERKRQTQPSEPPPLQPKQRYYPQERKVELLQPQLQQQLEDAAAQQKPRQQQEHAYLLQHLYRQEQLQLQQQEDEQKEEEEDEAEIFEQQQQQQLAQQKYRKMGKRQAAEKGSTAFAAARQRRTKHHSVMRDVSSSFEQEEEEEEEDEAREEEIKARQTEVRAEADAAAAGRKMKKIASPHFHANVYSKAQSQTALSALERPSEIRMAGKPLLSWEFSEVWGSFIDKEKKQQEQQEQFQLPQASRKKTPSDFAALAGTVPAAAACARQWTNCSGTEGLQHQKQQQHCQQEEGREVKQQPDKGRQKALQARAVQAGQYSVSMEPLWLLPLQQQYEQQQQLQEEQQQQQQDEKQKGTQQEQQRILPGMQVESLMWLPKTLFELPQQQQLLQQPHEATLSQKQQQQQEQRILYPQEKKAQQQKEEQPVKKKDSMQPVWEGLLMRLHEQQQTKQLENSDEESQGLQRELQPQEDQQVEPVKAKHSKQQKKLLLQKAQEERWQQQKQVSPRTPAEHFSNWLSLQRKVVNQLQQLQQRPLQPQKVLQHQEEISTIMRKGERLQQQEEPLLPEKEPLPQQYSKHTELLALQEDLQQQERQQKRQIEKEQQLQLQRPQEHLQKSSVSLPELPLLKQSQQQHAEEGAAEVSESSNSSKSLQAPPKVSAVAPPKPPRRKRLAQQKAANAASGSSSTRFLQIASMGASKEHAADGEAGVSRKSSSGFPQAASVDSLTPIAAAGAEANVAAYTVSSRRVQRSEAEQAIVVHGPLKNYPDARLKAIFDGHGGVATSRTCASIAHEFLGSMLDLSSESFRSAMLGMDEYLYQNNVPGGSTGLMAVIERTSEASTFKIHVANLGDSRALLLRQDLSYVILSRDHRPNRSIEKARILRAGGFVTNQMGTSRINGRLAVSRALGDFHMKQNRLLAPTEQLVSAVPEVYTVDAQAGDVLLLACDGMFESYDMNRQAVAELAFSQMGNSEGDLIRTAQALLQAAYVRGSKDNISVSLTKLLYAPEHSAKVKKMGIPFHGPELDIDVQQLDNEPTAERSGFFDVGGHPLVTHF